MKKTTKILSLVLAIIFVFSGFPTYLITSKANAVQVQETVTDISSIFTILNNGKQIDTIFTNSPVSHEFLATENVPDAYGFSSKLYDWTKTILDITTDKDLYGVEAYAFYADTTAYYGTANSFNVSVTADDYSIVESNRLRAGFNYTGTYYLYGTDGVLTSAYSNSVNGISIPAGFKGHVILPVISENDSFNYKTFTKMTIGRSGYPAWGTDENGNSEAGLKSIILDNVSAVFDLDAFMSLKPYQIGTLDYDLSAFDTKIVTEIPKSASEVNVSFRDLPDAASYKAVLFRQTDSNYYYLHDTDITDTNVQFASLVPGEKYAVQILGLDSLGSIINTSYPKEFIAQQKGNFTVINNANDFSYISTTLSSAKTEQNISVFPDGAGFVGNTVRGASTTFINKNGLFDLAQYDAFALYVNYNPKNSTQFTIGNATDDADNVITDILDDRNTTTKYCNVYFIDAVTGAVSYPNTGDWGTGALQVADGMAGYFVFELSDNVYLNKKHTTNEINLNLQQWFSNSDATNMGHTVRFDNFSLIEDLDQFISSVTKNPQKLGYSPSNTSAVPTLSGPNETNGQAYMNVVWTAMTGARSYRINVFEEVNGNLVYKTTATSVTRNVDIPIEYGENLSVQVVGLTSSGTPAIASKVAYFDNTVYVPEILGASFNDAGDIRFVGNTPAKILSSYTVKGY
ncbi:MAG: hypothetical protein IJN65_00730, partial [Clostridia bacterium]|nr:hypothetical protein [Clostridia bacterium]